MKKFYLAEYKKIYGNLTLKKITQEILILSVKEVRFQRF